MAAPKTLSGHRVPQGRIFFTGFEKKGICVGAIEVLANILGHRSMYICTDEKQKGLLY